MQYAIIQSGGKQYKVSEKEEITVDRLAVKEGNDCLFPEVLLLKSEENILIGEPIVPNVIVSGKVVKHLKGDKIRVSKFKAKVNYRRTIGFRPHQTQVLIEKISFEQPKKAKTPKTASKKQ